MIIEQPTSYHGGHSGQFCCHAEDTLEDIIRAYIRRGFTRVGITEHVPPVSDRFLYPDEIRMNFSAKDLLERFELYFTELARLKRKYADQIRIFSGMETETVTGYKDHIRALIEKFKPDYIVGSVHHVSDICFDYSPDHYKDAVRACGSMENLYCRYFDEQHEMITALRPFVVGHFDLIRIFDPDYEKHLSLGPVSEKIDRNLELIQSLGLVMDFNLRPLARGEKEPYLCRPILEKIKRLGIRLVPGDDAHSAAQAGNFVDIAIEIMKSENLSTNWPDPVMLNFEQEN